MKVEKKLLCISERDTEKNKGRKKWDRMFNKRNELMYEFPIKGNVS